MWKMEVLQTDEFPNETCVSLLIDKKLKFI